MFSRRKKKPVGFALTCPNLVRILKRKFLFHIIFCPFIIGIVEVDAPYKINREKMSSLPRSNDLGSSRVTDVGSKIDQIIFDSYVTSTDIILKGRNGHVHPKRSEKSAHIESFTSNSDFCTQALSSWKQDVSVPLYIDLSLVLSKSKKILIERWKFCYQRVNDTSKPVKAKLFQKRIVTFLRTLYSFIRLLPGYQVLKLLPHAPNLVFEILDSEDPPIAPSQLASEVWKMYDFPSMGTPRGLLAVAVCYVETSVLQVR